MGETNIAWTEMVWNPIRGCSRVSAGCTHCYAERMAARFSGPGQPYEGLTSIHPSGERRWTGEVRFVPEMLGAPLRWRKPRRVFVNSMSDLWHPKVTAEQIAAVFGVMAACPQHTFQVLTKRPERMVDWFRWADNCGQPHECIRAMMDLALPPGGVGNRSAKTAWDNAPWPLPNVWIGVTAENQAAADERIPLLLQAPAAVRFVSCEPLLEPINFSEAGLCLGVPLADGSRWFGTKPGIDWIIAGGESGPHARPCNVEWIRSIVRQCKAAGVAVFCKQLGDAPYMSRLPEWWEQGGSWSCRLKVHSGRFNIDLDTRAGSDPTEWHEDLRIREYPR